MRAAALPRGYVGNYWRRSHQQKTIPFSVSWGERVFSQCPGSGWWWSGELDALPLSTKTLSSSWISPKTSRLMPQTNSCRRRMLVDRLKLEPSALVWYDVRWWVQGQPIPNGSSCARIPSVSWCNNPLAIQQQDEKLGHVHCSPRVSHCACQLDVNLHRDSPLNNSKKLIYLSNNKKSLPYKQNPFVYKSSQTPVLCNRIYWSMNTGYHSCCHHRKFMPRGHMHSKVAIVDSWWGHNCCHWLLWERTSHTMSTDTIRDLRHD